MNYTSLDEFLASGAAALKRGPIALVFVEDDVEVATTLRHHHDSGFKTVVAFMPKVFDLPGDVMPLVERVDYDATAPGAVTNAVNSLMSAAAGQWVYYCYNAEYLFFPFCETRSIGEMLAFHTQERRNAMLTYVVDLYADDLAASPQAVSLDDAYLDRSGYYALARTGSDTKNSPLERQLDFFGVLRWRFEEHIPHARRKIDRIALFRAAEGLSLRDNHTLSDEEYNTYACPWHHNLTAAICSFRDCKSVKKQPREP